MNPLTLDSGTNQNTLKSYSTSVDDRNPNKRVTPTSKKDMKKRRTMIFENMLSQVNGGMDGAMKAAE